LGVGLLDTVADLDLDPEHQRHVQGRGRKAGATLCWTWPQHATQVHINKRLVNHQSNWFGLPTPLMLDHGWPWSPKDRPVTAADIHHTIYRVLGVDPHLSFLNHAGRPIAALEPGAPIEELL
jgi:hypothetical protein